MNDLTEKLAKIEASCRRVIELEKEAAPSPWGYSSFEDSGKTFQHLQSNHEGVGVINTWPAKGNVEFIATSRNLTPALANATLIAIGCIKNAKNQASRINKLDWGHDGDCGATNHSDAIIEDCDDALQDIADSFPEDVL